MDIDLERVAELDQVESALKEDGQPVTISLRWWGEREERQTLVLHEFKDGQVLLFDPSRELSSHLESEGRQSRAPSEGMLWVSREVVEEWFSQRDAVGMLSSPLSGSDS